MTDTSNEIPFQSECGRTRSRREFLRVSAVGAVALASGCRSDSLRNRPGDVDAHVHVWSPDLDRYPIDASFMREDMQPSSFTPEQLFAHTGPNGVSRVVLIQMSFYQFDNRYLLDSMERYPKVFSGVAIVDEHVAGVAERMKALAARGVRGFRIYPGRKSAEDWLGSSGMASMWETGADQGLALCPLINAEALPAIESMCRRYPRTRVVIDHFARIGVDGQMRDAQVEALCRLARFPNTYVKTSAFYALGKKKAPYTDLGPMIQRLRDAFGAHRLMWASDCPYQVDPGHTYADSIKLIRAGLPFLSAEDRDWMLRRTADKVFFS
jgi:predicted TIM-barrel fold metal-dependent hydrolase